MTQSILITYGDGSTQTVVVANIDATHLPPAQAAFAQHIVTIGNTAAGQAILFLEAGPVVKAVQPPVPEPPPPVIS